MTKSTITRERLEEIVSDPMINQGSEFAMMARMALAAMDSEPVAWTWQHLKQWHVTNDEERARDLAWDGVKVEPLYRHAQPVPVAYSDFESFWSSYIHPLAQDDELKGFAWDIWCAAMLQAGNSSAHVFDRPVAWHHTAKSKEGNHGTCCFSYASSHDFGPRYEKPQSQPHYLPERLDYDRALHFLSTEPRKVTPETVIGGSSPVIPEGWTGNDKANAALMMLDRIETVDPVDDDRIDGIKRIVRELAAAPHDTHALNSVQSVDSVADRWIPVSERVPTKQDGSVFLTWNGQYISKELFLMGSFQCLKPEIITHWMPLPAAPQEVK
ncbi:DUF551 domain-containing protein [Klebsiella quasipneumoniae]|nr:DUF551 domain-containing protein [Klebsiella quasipneumoniae]MDZ2011093.1 DUF551 domain-containing protein [Klebsiella quasipneumoniae]